MKNEIRVWRCEEDAAIVRALENLQQLAARTQDDKEETKFEQTRYIQETVTEGNPDAN